MKRVFVVLLVLAQLGFDGWVVWRLELPWLMRGNWVASRWGDNLIRCDSQSGRVQVWNRTQWQWFDLGLEPAPDY